MSLACGPAHADRRVALVIGNSAYKSAPKLGNPVNDATLVGGMFKKAGFDSVDVRLDLSASEMRRMLREFAGRSRDAEMAVIYYAGHGIELDGNNYLIPTDATLETDGDVLDETIPVERALFAVEPAKQLRLIILDACRDNPFAKTMKRTLASRAVGRGLAKVEPTSPNTMIAFAAKAGSTASDGDSRNSPFAAALVEHLPKPGLDLRKAFGFVRDDVLKATGYKQEPYVYGSLGGDDVPLVAVKPAATGPQANPQEAVRRDYELALQLGTRDGWEAFLAAYPEGFYANLAKGQLNKIAAEETRAGAEQKAKAAEQEKARLVAERAQKAEQEKAAAAAKAAEEARIAAEKQKQIEQARAEAAEQQRKVAEAAAAKALAEKQAAEKARAELAAKQAAEKAEQAAKPATDRQIPEVENQKVAALSPAPTSTLSAAELAKSVQSELRRVGCLTSAAEGEWTSAAQRSLTLFNKYAGTQFDVKLASSDALDALKAKPGRVCPLVCNFGFKADGDQCVKITCRAGYRVGDDNECEKIPEKKPVATREDSKRRDRDRKQTEAAPSAPQASGQVICNAAGCRPIAKGCRLGTANHPSNPASKIPAEICN
ncbi:caspase family protein [Bradyrhizobium sp. 182]|uniref:caspase family protein n=1 Tax=unclassified Bradyrhizobium TaxID=2631580 RepID=UPI001FF98167|nr:MULTISPECIES: caspase family protein [unclassified Bradyrhizobium]MCK1424371.1 caspase family protein [Bradyrhizobium sp. CW12]MCK1529149.1 caspase family protein [Bradyrhizobium sp. 182]MCK1596338.1 caspase family protein [Bradyrhizobium sp. 164]MCK1649442.1 caspase family protein [Bradyrhizobium sp. 154]MCK1664423.1 caspase family protein [Bradyrhizobium sp. 153]